MKIITLNANGIRAAARKGFLQWLIMQAADIICIQETKAQIHQLEDEIFHPTGYHCYYADAIKKGYSGVAIYSKYKPDNIKVGLGLEAADNEGRYIQIDIGDLSVASLYLPSGTSGTERQSFKYEFLDFYLDILKQQLIDSTRQWIITGDWNIAHKPIDLKNWKANQKHSGFLPEERAWLDKLFDEVGYVDAFRVCNQNADEYTWWSNRGQAWAKNVGWRIDYHVVSPNLKEKITNVSVYKDERFSDHAPLIINYDCNLS